jgi:virginiamycin B lyase
MNKLLSSVGTFLLFAVLLAGSGMNSAVNPAITEFDPPDSVNTLSYGITSGPDGAVWFVGDHTIGRISLTGQVKTFTTPRHPLGITSGPDGALWFTDGASVGRLTIAGKIDTWHLPTYPTGAITAGPDGALWFMEECLTGNVRIGRATLQGNISEYVLTDVPCVDDGLIHPLARGPGNTLWFINNGVLWYMTTTDSAVKVPIGGYVEDITLGSDGALWFIGNSDAGGVGRITADGNITWYREPLGDEIVAGPDGALWVTRSGAQPCTAWRMTGAGRITGQVQKADCSWFGAGLAPGQNGTLWVAETVDTTHWWDYFRGDTYKSFSDRIVRIQMPQPD